MACTWFKPFKHRNDFSVGVIYMVLMNLPRSIRFRKENVILLGVVPALAYEQNNFLKPAVDELNALWKGLKVNTYNSPSTAVEIQAAVLCFASDIPAGRKLWGFLVPNEVALIVARCFQEVLEKKRTYGGFQDRDQWPKGTSQEHRHSCLKAIDTTAMKRPGMRVGKN